MKTLFLILLLALPAAASAKDDYYTNTRPRSYSGGSGMADRTKINRTPSEEKTSARARFNPEQSQSKCKRDLPLARSGGSQSQVRIESGSVTACRGTRQ